MSYNSKFTGSQIDDLLDASSGMRTSKEDTANKVTSLDNPSDVTYPTSKAVKDYIDAGLSEKEDVSNKSTVIDISADDIHYPTTKSVLNAVSAVENRKITPEMLSETTKQYIESSGGGTITNLADDEDLTSVDNVLKLADKEYSPALYSGMGRVYLRKNIVGLSNILTQEMMEQVNTIYIIQYDYDLNGATINVPSGCVLDFQGGSLANGTIVGDSTSINAGNVKIFDNNLIISGNWQGRLNVAWYGAIPSPNIDYNDVADNIQAALDSSFDCIYFPCGYYYCAKTLTLSSKMKNIVLEGDSNANLNVLATLSKQYQKAACIYTNLDIDLFVVAIVNFNGLSTSVAMESDSFTFVGGQLDVSLCPNYSHTCFRINRPQFLGNNFKVKTFLCGSKHTINSTDVDYSTLGKGIGVYESETTSNQSICYSTFDCNIYSFDIGFYTGPTTKSGPWMTSVSILGIINSCNVPIKLESSCLRGGKFAPIIQSSSQCYLPLLQGDFGNSEFEGFIWDAEKNHIIADSKALLTLTFSELQYKVWFGTYANQTNGLIKGTMALNRGNMLTTIPMLLPGGNNYMHLSSYFDYNTLNDWKNLDIVDNNVVVSHEESGITYKSTGASSIFSITGKSFEFSNVSISDTAKFKVTIDLTNSTKETYTVASDILIRFNSSSSFLRFKHVKCVVTHKNGSQVVSCDDDVYYPSQNEMLYFNRDCLIIHSGVGVMTSRFAKLEVEFTGTLNTNTTFWMQVAATGSSYINSLYRNKGELIYNVNDKNLYLFEDNKYNKVTNGFLSLKSGISSKRPTGIDAGYQFFDTTLGKPIWWNGSAWVDSTGAVV